jgi:hypothetical protein
VYRSGQISASIDLKAGPVGIVFPLRALAQSAFFCQFRPLTTQSIKVYNPKFVPDAVPLSDVSGGMGLLITTLFAVPVHNLQSHAITLEYRIDKPPLGMNGESEVREVRHPLAAEDSTKATRDNYRREGGGTTLSAASGEETQTIVSAGQTALLTLELRKVKSASSKGRADVDDPIYIPCRKSKPFTLTVIPSRGDSAHTLLDIRCRSPNQSFSISYLDHDLSVSQAAAIFPTRFHSPLLARKTRSPHRPSEGQTCRRHAARPQQCAEEGPTQPYPVLLTLHGSGIQPENHADSHKYMHPAK